MRPPKPPRPIYIFCYHKVGTVLLRKVFRHICRDFGWRFREVFGYADDAPENADVVLFMHSLVAPAVLERPFRGIHLIRDPRDVIVSGYLYHKRCSEEWCVNTDFDATAPIRFPRVPYSQQHRPEAWKRRYLASLDGRSYQENLHARSQRDGLLFELENYGSWTTASMLEWDYSNPHILELQFETVMRQYDASFERIFEHVGFTSSQARKALALARREDLSRKSDAQIRWDDHISSRTTTRWPRFFEDVHHEALRERFGDPFSVLGYAPDPRHAVERRSRA